MSAEPEQRFQLQDDVLLRLLHSSILRVSSRAKATFVLALIAVVVAAGPLIVLCLLDGTLIGGVGTLLLDVDVLVRLLITLPLLIIVTVPVSRQLQTVLIYLLESEIVPPDQASTMQELVAQLERRRHSVLTWVITVAITYIFMFYVRDTNSSVVYAAAWFTDDGTIGGSPSPAGWWYTFVAGPLVIIFVVRWIWLMLTWGAFIRKIAALPLRLVPSHPDLMGGLGYVSQAQGIFSLVAFCLSTMAAGRAASDILFAGGHVLNWAPAMAVVTVFLVLLINVPMMFFAGRLLSEQRMLLQRFGGASAHVSRYLEDLLMRSDQMVTAEEARDPIFSAHADMTASFQNAEAMTGLPFSKKAFLQVLLMAAIPFVPVIGIEYDLVELLEKIMVLV
jgi:hypothetical protein